MAGLVQPYGINDSGQIVGYFSDASGYHGFLRDAGGTACTVFDVPNFIGNTFATGINNVGQVAGYVIDYSSGVGIDHGFWGKPKPDPVIKDVPQWYQAGIPNTPGYPPNFWGTARLDSTLPFQSIRQGGCALTALTMVTDFWLMNRITPSASNHQPGLTPAILNARPWNLYLPGPRGLVSWKNDILQNAGIGLVRLLPNYNNLSSSNGFPIINNDYTQTLDNILRNGVPVILRIVTSPQPGYPNGKAVHFVVVTGKAPNGDYYVNDPGWYPSMTLYNLSQTAWWGVHVSNGETPCIPCSLSNADDFLVYTNLAVTQKDPLTLKGLGVYSTDPVDFILKDPQGHKTGFDPVSNTLFHDIPVSDYSATIYRDEQDASPPSPPPLRALVMANQLDGQYTLNVVGTGSGNFTLYVIASDAAGNDVTQSYAGTTAPGVSSQFIFQGGVTTFAALTANVAISQSHQAFGVDGTFTLGSGGTISPVTQPMTIQIGNGFLATIPTGSFEQTPQGTFIFGGVIQNILLSAALTPTGGGSYAFAIGAAGAPDLPTANPVDVHLAIGFNGGNTSVNATFLP